MKKLLIGFLVSIFVFSIYQPKGHANGVPTEPTCQITINQAKHQFPNITYATGSCKEYIEGYVAASGNFIVRGGVTDVVKESGTMYEFGTPGKNHLLVVYLEKTENPKPNQAKPTLNGWVKDGGNWLFYSKGAKKTGWLLDKGKWYFLNYNGTMATGWVEDQGKWYFLDQSGAMKTGWLLDKGKWYFLKSNGDMATGWLKTGGKWYYLDQSGAMKTGWILDKGKWYYLNSSGAMATGWLKTGGKWYFLDQSGAMRTGWIQDQGKWYFLNASGAWVG